MATISHNVELMQEWTSCMGENASNYDELVSRLYNLVNQFVGSEDFKGGLSTDFEENLNRLRPEFQRYSETFRESIDFVNERANSISDAESELTNRINNGNLLG